MKFYGIVKFVNQYGTEDSEWKVETIDWVETKREARAEFNANGYKVKKIYTEKEWNEL